MVRRTPKMKPETVAAFLKEVRQLAETAGTSVINNRPWANGRVNKTQQYMAETGITSQVVREVGDRFLLIMSFHPEKPTSREPKLEFSFRNYQEAEETCPSGSPEGPQKD